MTSALISRPSENDALTRLPPETTCAEVSMYPSEEIARPLPAPSATRPRRVRLATARCATEGVSLSATPATVRE